MKKALVLSVLMACVPALGFSQTVLTGTYRFSANAYVTFTGNAFTGLWNATTPISGTYSVSGARLSLAITGGPKAKNTWVWTVVDANTLKDQDGDTWKKEGAGGTAQARTSPPIEWNVNNMATWIEAVGGVRSGGNNKAHTITVTGDISVPTSNESTFGSVSGVTVTIQGDGTLTLSGKGSLIVIGAGQTVVLKGDITLKGRDDNDYGYPLVRINEKGIFRMEDNSTVMGNNGGGVSVGGGGTFTMSGGTISGNGNHGVSVGGTFTMNGGTISGNKARDNESSSGGGVSVWGTFTMNGGTISGNSALYYGGGVSLGSDYDRGTFNMNGGTISGNTAGFGGGVCARNGTFNMSDGMISGNTASSGGGVYVNNTTFTMSGGTISGNTAGFGGGVCAKSDDDRTFTMSNGTIMGNIAKNGGGVFVTSWYGGRITFTMKGGSISGNTADFGGGMYIERGGECTKTGGTISGNDASETDRNRAYERGNALYHERDKNWRNTTVGPRVNLDAYGFWMNEEQVVEEVKFPSGFIGTWKRDNFNNTLTLTSTTLKSSSQNFICTLIRIYGDSFKLKTGDLISDGITIRLTNGNLVISGDSGSGEDNWNGTWRKQ